MPKKLIIQNNYLFNHYYNFLLPEIIETQQRVWKMNLQHLLVNKALTILQIKCLVP